LAALVILALTVPTSVWAADCEDGYSSLVTITVMADGKANPQVACVSDGGTVAFQVTAGYFTVLFEHSNPFQYAGHRVHTAAINPSDRIMTGIKGSYKYESCYYASFAADAKCIDPKIVVGSMGVLDIETASLDLSGGPQVLTIRNSGNTTVSDVSVKVLRGSFTVTFCAPSNTLAPGETCQVSVAPSSAGTGTLAVTYKDKDEDQHSLQKVLLVKH